MVNPDKYIRKAYIDMCKVFMPNTVWEAGVPINITPTPTFYILITNQTRNETEVSKGVVNELGELTNSTKEWLCTITVDINRVQPKGNYGSAPVDDLEQQIMNVIENDELVVPGFIIKSRRIVQSQPLTASNTTQTITRKVFTYEHWLNNID